MKFTVNISTPVSFEITDAESFKNKYFPEAIPMVVISFTLEIEGKLKSEFLNIMPEKLAKGFWNHLRYPWKKQQRFRQKIRSQDQRQ